MKFKIEKKGYSTAEVDDYLKKITDEYDSVSIAQTERIHDLKSALVETEARIKAYKEKTGLITKAIYNAVAKAEEIERLSKLKYEQEIAQLKAFHEKWMSYYNKILEKYPIDEDLIYAGKFNRQMRKILASAGESAKDGVSANISDILEKTYENEKKRLEEKRIGYITVKTRGKADETEEGDDAILKTMIPGADLSSPIISGEFDPVERIKQYLASEKTKQKEEKKKKKSSDTAAAKGGGKSVGSAENYGDCSPSGFSFEEALNPKDDLEQIMRDLGLLLSDDE